MKRLIFLPLLLFCLIVSSQTYYGTPFSADAKQNNPVGHYPSGELSYRFRATKTGDVKQLMLFLVYSWLGGEGYSAGDGGIIKLTLETDDGTANHLPSGEVLTTVVDSDPRGHLPIDIHVYHVTYTFDSPVSLRAGTLYHIHFVNIHSDPRNNWIGINSLYEAQGLSQGNPTGNSTDLALLVKENATWELYNTSLPIYTLIYTDGVKTGQGFCEAGNNIAGYFDNVSGSNYKVRSNFTISGVDRTVSKVTARLKRVSGTEDLTMRLEEADGTLIEQGTVAYSSIDAVPTWATVVFTSPHTLTAGKNYHLVLSTGGSTTYQTGSIQDGSFHHGYAVGFADGHYEKMTNGSTWADHTWGDWTPGEAFKAPVYFEVSEIKTDIPDTDSTTFITNIDITTVSDGGNAQSNGGVATIDQNGGTLQLSAVIYPADATNKTVSWSIQNGTGKATINSSGLVYAVAAGTVTATASATDGSDVSDNIPITIQQPVVVASDSKEVYIDPTNSSDLSQDGTIDHPYSSWNMVTWKNGYTYMQKSGTVSNVIKINIGASDIVMGSYGEGEKPVIQSDENDFAIRSFEKNNILIKDLHIINPNGVSCIYIIGESCDSIYIENCTLESTENGVRIMNAKNVILRYNTFINCSNAIYCYAEKSLIYYNVFRDNQVAINAMADMASAEIYNNVFYNNAVGVANTYSELTLFNNIFYLANSTEKAINDSHLNKLISDNNIFYPEQESFIKIGDKVYGSLRDYQHDLGLDLNSITDDPEFKDVYNYNFSLEPSSPAINRGKFLGQQQDFFGTEVPSGGIPDIGLAEFNSSGAIISSISHLNDPAQDDFQVYPNPNRGIFNVHVKNNNSEGSRITIKDLSGKTVYENIYSSDIDLLQQIDISHMQKGIYIVAVEEKTRTLSQPIIVN